MLKKKIFGFFGKKEIEEESSPSPRPPDPPVISSEQISSLENLSEEAHSAEEAPEDIISKLAQIDSIIGKDETEESDDLEDLFADESEKPPSGAAHDTVEEEVISPGVTADTLKVSADLVLKCFPTEMLSDSVENLVSQHGSRDDFSFFFDRSDLLYGLSIGKLEFTVGQLVDKLPINVFQDHIASVYNTKIELPMAQILPLIPVAWFVNRDQDCSRELMVNEMEDLFTPIQPAPAQDKSVAQKSEVHEEQVETGQSSPSEALDHASSLEAIDGAPSDMGQATEELPMPGGKMEKVDETRWSPQSDAISQDVVGVSQLRRPAVKGDDLPVQKMPPGENQDSVVPEARLEKEMERPTPPEEAFKQPSDLPVKELPGPKQDLVRTPREKMRYAPSAIPSKDIGKPKPRPSIDADEVRQVAAEVFVSGDQKPRQELIKDIPREGRPPVPTDVQVEWKSQAPNGIDINRGGVEELMLLTGVGEHLARVIIDFRKTHGSFIQLQDLLKVPGLGNHTYRSMTRLSPNTNLRDAEQKINDIFKIKSEKVSLNKLANISMDYLKLDAMFISSIDGLVLTKSASSERHMKLADSLAAVAPQLYKRSKKALQQGLLPSADMISFYFDKRSVTFSGSDQLFIVYIHNIAYPHQKQLKECRKITNELVWYCSYRAVLG